MKITLNIVFTFIIIVNLYCQENSKMMFQNGKCYSKCIMPNEYMKGMIICLEYTGDDIFNPFVREIPFKSADENIKYRLKETPNCNSDFPENCFEWESYLVPEKIEDFYVVKDTSKIKEFKSRSIPYRYMIKQGGFEAWREVVCERTPELISQIAAALSKKGFEVIDSADLLDVYSKLGDFQQINNLPIGALDFETLKSLGIKI